MIVEHVFWGGPNGDEVGVSWWDSDGNGWSWACRGIAYAGDLQLLRRRE